jgi:hypothetical protein
MRTSGLSVPVAALLSGLLTAAAAQEFARDSAFPPREPAPSTNSLGREHAIAPGAVATAQRKPRTGNPLWAIAVDDLSETHARPIFSSSRRPPAAADPAALAAQPVKAASPVKPEPDHPLLDLLGTIVGGSVEIGVFVDEASHDVIRPCGNFPETGLRRGDARAAGTRQRGERARRCHGARRDARQAADDRRRAAVQVRSPRHPGSHERRIEATASGRLIPQSQNVE